jgi:hypothetical protein
MMMLNKLVEQKSGGKRIVLYGHEDGEQEIYIDGAHGVTLTGTVVKINMFTVAPTFGEENEERREIVARLVMQIQTFVALAEFLNSTLQSLVSMGVIQKVESSKINS